MPFTGLEIWNSKYLQKVQLFSFPQFCHSTNASNKWLCKGFLGEQLSVISYLWSTNSHNLVAEHQPEMHFSECSLLLPPNHQPPMYGEKLRAQKGFSFGTAHVSKIAINQFFLQLLNLLSPLPGRKHPESNPGKTKLERFYGLFFRCAFVVDQWHLWWMNESLFFSDVPMEKRRNLTTFSDANGCHTARCISNHLAPSLTCVCFCPFPSPKHRFWSYEMFHQNTHQTMCVLRVSQCFQRSCYICYHLQYVELDEHLLFSLNTWTTCCITHYSTKVGREVSCRYRWGDEKIEGQLSSR